MMCFSGSDKSWIQTMLDGKILSKIQKCKHVPQVATSFLHHYAAVFTWNIISISWSTLCLEWIYIHLQQLYKDNLNKLFVSFDMLCTTLLGSVNITKNGCIKQFSYGVITYLSYAWEKTYSTFPVVYLIYCLLKTYLKYRWVKYQNVHLNCVLLRVWSLQGSKSVPKMFFSTNCAQLIET